MLVGDTLEVNIIMGGFLRTVAKTYNNEKNPRTKAAYVSPLTKV